VTVQSTGQCLFGLGMCTHMSLQVTQHFELPLADVTDERSFTRMRRHMRREAASVTKLSAALLTAEQVSITLPKMCTNVRSQRT